ncbi:MAG: serine hydrolase [Bacillota bacterium]|nr:serine hydrolase [Bacillota bacterium]
MKDIKKYLETRCGEYSFYFEDINSEYTYSLNDKNRMPATSCIQVPIGMVLLKQVYENKINLNSKIFVSKNHMTDGSGIIKEFDEKEYTIRELLNAMLIVSDNTAANIIIDLLGFTLINDYIEQMGLTNTYLNRNMMDLDAKEKGIDNYSCSFDLAKCFKILYTSSFLNKEYSEMLINIMKKPQNRNNLAFYMPSSENFVLINKDGGMLGTENDAGLLMLEKGCFVYSIMCNKLPNSIYGVHTISTVTKVMCDIICNNWG